MSTMLDSENDFMGDDTPVMGSTDVDYRVAPSLNTMDIQTITSQQQEYPDATIISGADPIRSENLF